MIKKLKDTKFYGIIYTIASAFFIMAMSMPFFTNERLFSNLFDTGVDVLGALICVALFYGCMKQEGEGSRVFRIMIVLVCSCFTVNIVIMYVLIVVPEQTVLAFVFCMLSKLIDLALIYLFYLYAKATLGFEGKFAKVVEKIVPILLGVQLILLLLNCFLPVTFYVDGEGYHETSIYLLEEVYLAVTSVLTTILILMSKNPFHQKAAVLTFIFMPLVPWFKRMVGKKNMFYLFLTAAIIGMGMLYFISKMEQPSMMMIYVAQFIKSTGVIVATGYMWALVPEVISYGEYTTGRRISGIVNALTGLFFKAGMTFGSIVGPAVLAFVGYNSAEIDQTPVAEEGILWLVCVIPAILLALAMFIISKYELTDEVIDDINKKIEARG